jgi:hypothetical protein
MAAMRQKEPAFLGRPERAKINEIKSPATKDGLVIYLPRSVEFTRSVLM